MCKTPTILLMTKSTVVRIFRSPLPLSRSVCQFLVSLTARSVIRRFIHSSVYRVSQVSCNRHISVSRNSNWFLKKDLWRSRSALFVVPNLNFEYWIVADQENIKWVVTLSGKLSFSLLILEVSAFSCLPFFDKLI